jgi:hypothetical protein
MERAIKEKSADLTKRGASKNDLARVLSPMETELRNARADLQRLLLKRSEVIEYAKREATLFGVGALQYRRKTGCGCNSCNSLLIV